MSEYIWKKPVVSIFRERTVNREIDPFVVIRAKQLKLVLDVNQKYSGTIDDFFTLMGDADYLKSPEGKVDHYVMCWFDDAEPDMSKDFRRLRGVTFNGAVSFNEDEKTGKRTYNATFKAEHAKIT